MRDPQTRCDTKRVLVAHNVERHGSGGMARMMESIHIALESFGWETDYFTAEDMADVWSQRLRRYSFSWHARRHARRSFLRGKPYNIINIHEPAGAAMVFAKSRFGRPAIVAMSHGVEQRYWELRLRGGSAGSDAPGLKERISVPALSLWQSRLTLCRADHVLCLNEEDRTFLQTRFHLKGERVTPVYPGAGPEFSSAAPRRIYDRPCTSVLFSGSWIARKGIRQVIESFSLLGMRYPELRLGVLGAGVPPGCVFSAFPESLHSRIEIFPPLSHADCAEVLLRYDIFLLPSFFEGTPLGLIEAMQTGIPVITTATAGMKDVIRDGKSGLLVPPGNCEEITRAVERLMNNPDLRQRLGRQAFSDAVSKYTWPAAARVVDGIYSSLLKT